MARKFIIICSVDKQEERMEYSTINHMTHDSTNVVKSTSMIKIFETFEKKRFFISKISSEREYGKNDEYGKLFCNFLQMHLIKYNLIAEHFPFNCNKSNVGTEYKEEKSLFGCFSKLYLTKLNNIIHLNITNRMWVQGINRSILYKMLKF